MTKRCRKNDLVALLAALCLSVAALAAWASPLGLATEGGWHNAGLVLADPPCGDGILDDGEECDDGGACLGGENEGEPCTSFEDCTGGECRPFGGDGCAANCTFESVHRLPIDTEESEALITGNSFDLTSGLPRFALIAGRAAEDGAIPLVIPAAEVRLPLSFSGSPPPQDCVCLRGVEDPAFGPGNAGAGILACGAEGLNGRDLVVRRDHRTNDVDPDCEAGTLDQVHPGVCNGPEIVESSMTGPPGSAVFSLRFELYEIPFRACTPGHDIGLCSPGSSVNELLPCTEDAICGDGRCVPANGADGIPCTDDDPTATEPGSRGTAYFTTGTARAEVVDAGDTQPYQFLVGESVSGAPFDCELAGESAADLSAAALAGTFVALDHAVLQGRATLPPLDLVASLRFAFLPEFAGGGVCGDGSTDPGEECDDGNVADGDGCDWNCTASACGNGLLAPDEECDDGNADPFDGCTNDCTVCGNDVTSPPEKCDDGNLSNGDGCDADCTVTTCGNGIVTGGEECDDGNRVDGDGCDSNCTVTACGNGVVSAGEECDDGNTNPFDGCTNGCTRCGNGVATGGEECDDGNRIATDGCTTACTVCGDDRVGAPERCDDGNLEDGDGCDSNCTPSGCGNGVADATEQCDDGGICVGGPRAGRVCREALECDGAACVATSGDGCTARCTIERLQRLKLDPERSRIEVENLLGMAPFPLSGEIVLTTELPDEAGALPLAVRIDDWRLDPIPLSGYAPLCLCIDAVGAAGADGGQAGIGTIWCAGEGTDGVDVSRTIDHDTTDVDPACTEGRYESGSSCIAGSCEENARACLGDTDCVAFHPGVCNGPEGLIFSGSGPPGSAQLEIALSAKYLFGPECTVEACRAAVPSADLAHPSRAAYGDLEADTRDRMGVLGYPVPPPPLLPLPGRVKAIFTTGIAHGGISDAVTVPGAEIAADATGAPFVCRNGSPELRSGGALVAALPTLDGSRGDAVALITLAFARTCPGDCDGSGAVSVAELLTAVNVTLGTTPVSACEAADSDGNQTITIDEVVGAVQAGLEGCPPSAAEQRCLDSGGTVSSGPCCTGAGDFPDTCAIGPCGCAPEFSEEVMLCRCGEGRCFDPALGCVAREGAS